MQTIIADATITIHADRIDHENRTVYEYIISTPRGVYASNDLRSGVGMGSEEDGLSSLISFLSAAAEAYDHEQRTGRPGENTDLFPPHVVEWASANSNELQMAACDCDE